MAGTTQDDGFHEIQLNGKQLVFLFMAATVVTVVIFLCGVLVGRGVRLERGGVVEARGPEATDIAPPVPAESGNSSQPSPGDPLLKYPEVLEGKAPAAEKLAVSSAPEARSEPVDEPPPPPPPAAVASASAAPPSGDGIEIQVSAYRERRDADALANRLLGKGYKAYVVAPAAGAPVLFRVRVGKFDEPREADRVSARLKKEEKLDPWIVR